MGSLAWLFTRRVLVHFLFTYRFMGLYKEQIEWLLRQFSILIGGQFDYFLQGKKNTRLNLLPIPFTASTCWWAYLPVWSVWAYYRRRISRNTLLQLYAFMIFFRRQLNSKGTFSHHQNWKIRWTRAGYEQYCKKNMYRIVLYTIFDK